MADIFRDREKAYESKYKMNEELKFKAESRRNRLLGEWLAGRFGLTAEEKKAYAKDVVVADMEAPGIEDLIRKVMKDIAAHGATITERKVRKKIKELSDLAFEQVSKEFPKALGPDHGRVGD